MKKEELEVLLQKAKKLDNVKKYIEAEIKKYMILLDETQPEEQNKASRIYGRLLQLEQIEEYIKK